MGLKALGQAYFGWQLAGSNRTIVGLKALRLRCAYNSEAAGSNRTIVGLKAKTRVTTKSAFPKGSNRTIVGLKDARQDADGSKSLGSNRTIVGLKEAFDPDAIIATPAAIAPLWD